MSKEFAGIRTIVTGGGSGVGLATARMFADRGASVAVLDIAPAGAPEQTHKIYCDLADSASVAQAMAQAVEALGGLDVLVNNAGIGAVGTIEDNAETEWVHVLNVDVLGTMRMTRAALPHLRKSASAAIVIVGSFVAEIGTTNRALLSTAKGALHALTRALAADHAGENILVNSVIPGTIDTAGLNHVLAAAADPEATRAALVARQPTGRLVSPDEVADAICYLANPRSRSTTGASLTLDGGITGIRFARQR